MAKNAIYFPYINVPPDPWLLRMALYWDQLNSIVPMDHIYSLELLTPQMRDLVASGLVHPLVPMQYLHDLRDFEGPFVRLAERWIARRRGDLGGRFTRIHAEKLDRLMGPLRNLGLATDDEYPWIRMPTPLANAFMSYLAASLGQLVRVDAAPITNSAPLGASLVTTERSLFRDALLEDLLPIPAISEELTIDSVLAFKAKYSAHATRFRERLEDECILVGNSASVDERKQRLAALKSKLQRESDEVADAMKMNWKAVSMGSILPVISAALPILDVDWKLGAAAGAGAVGSVGAAVYQASQAFEQARNAERRPMAYIPLVRKNLFNLTPKRAA